MSSAPTTASLRQLEFEDFVALLHAGEQKFLDFCIFSFVKAGENLQKRAR